MSNKSTAVLNAMRCKTFFVASCLLSASWVALGQTSVRATPAGRPSAGLTPAGPVPNLTCASVRERGPNSGSSMVAKPLPHDSRLVIFPYDKNALFPINTVFNRFTHFEFEAGEKILASYINDDTEWEQKISSTGSDILVRSKVRGAVGSMTTITDRRRYQIDLLDVSGCATESRYQRVSWQVTDQGFYEDRDAMGRVGRAMQQGLPISPSDAGQSALASNSNSFAMADAESMQVSLEGLNSDYVIEGDAELSPVIVLDDGKRTWLKFRANLALRPALFAVNPEGMGETVEYIPRGAYFVVPKIFSHGILLKLGKREVRIRNKSSSCGWFDAACRNVQTNNVYGGN
jgi:type IV secretory pathway VirB9-like protein